MGLIKCPNCGSNVLDDSGECFVCGYPLGDPAGVPFTTYTNNQQQEQQDSSQSAQVQAKASFFGRRKQSFSQAVQNQERPNFSRTVASIISALKILLLFAVIAFAFFLFYKYQQKKMDDLKQEYKQNLKDQANMTDSALEDIRKSLVKTVTTVDVETVKEIAETVSELVSLKYFYTDVTTYDNTDETKKDFFGLNIQIPLTENKVIFSYSGVISVGVNLDEVQYEVNNDRMVIKVKVPSPKIMSHEIDNNTFEFYDVKKGLFTRFDFGDFNDAQREMKNDAEKKLNDNKEYWMQARTQIEAIITNILTASGELSDYKILYEWMD